MEDDVDLQELEAMLLSEPGYRVVTAANGAVALAEVARRRPDLVLLDMKMPVMDGWEFARQMRAWYDHQTPIVVVTAAAEAAERAAEVGAEGYLSKPFDIDELVATVAGQLHPPA